MDQAEQFEREIERVRSSGVLGRTGRLRELFDFLAARGHAAEPATQADIAHEVFGQIDSGADDATARVYVHRLRKRLAEFYAREGAETGQLVLPAGSYELVLEQAAGTPLTHEGPSPRRWLVPALVVAALAMAFVLGRQAGAPGGGAAGNAIWQPFLESERPIVVAVGDYYIFGEMDPFDPERSRLIRDYAIDSPTDLALAQESEPARYERSEDVGLSYPPFSSVYALGSIMPVLARHAKPVAIVPASELTSQTLRDSNVVYVGLISGMGLLEDVTFGGSDFSVGETYDELRDAGSGRRYASGEALARASTEYYRDFGYIARFRQPGGALVAVVAGARETSLRGLAPLVAGALGEELESVAEGERGFDAVFEFTGQQGADLSSRLDIARARN